MANSNEKHGGCFRVLRPSHTMGGIMHALVRPEARLQAELEQRQGAAREIAQNLATAQTRRSAQPQEAAAHARCSTACRRASSRASEHTARSSGHLRDAEAAGGAALAVEQHLRHVLGQRDRDLYHAQVVQKAACTDTVSLLCLQCADPARAHAARSAPD